MGSDYQNGSRLTVEQLCDLLDLEVNHLSRKDKERLEALLDSDLDLNEIIVGLSDEDPSFYCPVMDVDIVIPCNLSKCKNHDKRFKLNCQLNRDHLDESNSNILISDDPTVTDFDTIAEILDMHPQDVEQVYETAMNRLRKDSLHIAHELEYSDYRKKFVYLNLKNVCMVCGESSNDLLLLKNGQACRNCILTYSRTAIELELTYCTSLTDLLQKTARPYSSLAAQAESLEVCIVTLIKLYSRCGIHRKGLFQKSDRSVRNPLVNRPGRRMPVDHIINILFHKFLRANYENKMRRGEELVFSFARKSNAIVAESRPF